MPLTETDILFLNASGVSWGSCYNYNSTGIVECSQVTESGCIGYYLEGTTCDTSILPQFNRYGSDFWISDPISSAEISTVSIGSEFQGGIYCGTFTPSSISFNNNIDTITSSDTTNYAIILFPTVFLSHYSNKILNTNTSNYNGRFNVGLNETVIPPNIDNVFKDWYFPSICELKFIINQYKQRFLLRNKISSIFGSAVMNVSSSSVFSITEPSLLQNRSKINKKYLYGMNIAQNSDFLINSNIMSNFLCIRSVEIT